MKKTLLIAAAALAAGVISSEAQVYSQNIVGYVNIPAKIGYSSIANPLDCGNSITNIVPPGPTWNYTTVFIWNGTGYTGYTIDSDIAGGVADLTDSFPVPAPTVNPGQAFFFFNNTGSSNTLTVAGNVHVGGPAAIPGGVGIATNTIGNSPLLSHIGSVIPVGGGLASALKLPATNSLSGFDYALVQIPTINNSGNITGFATYTVDSSFTSGFGDSSDSFEVPEPVIPVGTGFFFFNNTGGSRQWIQSF